MNDKKAVNVITRLEELKLTRKALADAAGVSERAVYHWLNYERVPRLTFAQVANICELLKWSAQELADAYEPLDESLKSAESEGDYAT